MKKFKLSRRRKKQYKKDLAVAYLNNMTNVHTKSIIEGNIDGRLASFLCINGALRDMRKLGDSLYKANSTKCHWEWFYFKRRVEVQSTFTIFNCNADGFLDSKTGRWVDHETPVTKSCSNEELVVWYKENYPEDKQAQHFASQNRSMWRNFK